MTKTAAISRQRDFTGRRWTIVFLRALHLVGIVALGASLLGASLGMAKAAVGGLVLCTGLAMFCIDLWSHEGHLRSVAGLTVLLKLALVAWLVLAPSPGLFWLVLIISAVVSHAPSAFRRQPLF